MTKELLAHILSNTMLGTTSRREKEFLEIIKMKINRLNDGQKLNNMELEKLLGNNWTIVDHQLKYVLPRIPSFIEKTNIEIFHEKIQHPAAPIAIYFKDERLVVLSLHFTTKNHGYEKICENILIGGEIPGNFIKDYESETGKNDINSIKMFRYDEVLQNFIRPKSTWFHGKLGDKPLIELTTLPRGKIQYISPVLIESDLDQNDISKLFNKDYNNIITLENKQAAQMLVKDMDNIEVINPINITFSTIAKDDLIFLDLTKSSYNFNLFEKEEFKDYLLISSNLTNEEYLIKTGKLVKLESPHQVDPIIKETDYINLLNQIRRDNNLRFNSESSIKYIEKPKNPNTYENGFPPTHFE